MVEFQCKSIAEVRKMSLDEFGKYLTDWNAATDKYHKQRAKTLNESAKKEFSSFEEARKYYGGITFDEFERRHFS